MSNAVRLQLTFAHNNNNTETRFVWPHFITVQLSVCLFNFVLFTVLCFVI